MSQPVTDIITPDGRLLVKEVEVEKKSAGGVILSANTSDPENTCKYGEIIYNGCLLYTSPSPRDRTRSRMPSSA